MPGVLLTIAVLIAGTMLTWLMTRAASQSEQQRIRTRLTRDARDIESLLESKLLAYEGLLRAGAGVTEAFGRVSAEQWRAFAGAMRLAAVYPGIQGIGFAARMDRAGDAERWMHALHGVGIHELHVWPTGEGRAPQTAIVYLEPLDERNRRAIGFDMTSEANRRRAMERARDDGSVALCGKVLLVQDSLMKEHPAGFLLFLPVYATPGVPPTLEERRRTLQGFVYAPFRARDFFAHALAAAPVTAAVEVFDGESPGSNALLYRSADSPLAEPVETRSLVAGGHVWTLRVASAATASAIEPHFPIAVIATVGAAMTLLLSGIVMSLALSRQRLRERMAAHAALATRERQAAQVLENALDAYIAIDANDTIVEWNRQATALFGWSAAEVIGMKLTNTIIPPALRQRHVAAITHFAERHEHALLGRRLELPALCRDGRELLVELSIVKIATPQGLRFAASLRDITDVRQQEAQIRTLNETLEQRVAERTAQLEVANRDLSAANNDLEAFTYSVSHDLRAPLRAIDGHVLRLTEHSSAMNDTQKHHAGAVRRNIARMNRLIDDLLHFAFVRKRPLDKQPVNLWDIVRPLLQELPAAKRIVYSVSPDDLGEVRADPKLLRQALENLLSNAVKFSRAAAPPRITVGSESREDLRVYFVRDNGVGFDMRYADKLFGVFERLHNESDFEGTGVGLAIVKQIIERHGGKVWAESTVGKGATFYFTLP